MRSDELPKGWLLIAALAYTAFAVYGSLVPLNFRPADIDQAWEAFIAMSDMPFRIASRTDWAVNILLFVPLSFLWCALIFGRTLVGKILAGCIIWLACVCLSIGIEFLQSFFPPRTPSLSDMVGESIGAATGVVLWGATGQKVMSWVQGWSRVRGVRSVSQQSLYGYLFVVFFYNVMPLDLSISPAEIYNKWRIGQVLVIPFSAWYASRVQMAYDILSDIAIWVPAAFLWTLSGKHSAMKVLQYVLASAAILEFLQLFVMSRTTDSTDLITAGVGALCGIACARVIGQGRRRPLSTRAGSVSGARVALWCVALIGWLVVLGVIFWYPFDFRTDGQFVRQRIGDLARAPLHAYYKSSELRALTELIHKTVFFLPLGVLLAIVTNYLRARIEIPTAIYHCIAGVGIAGVAAVIEAGQLLLPRKIADLTDWGLELLGGLAGYVLWLVLRSKLSGGRETRAEANARAHPARR